MSSNGNVNKVDTNKKMFGIFMIIILSIIILFFLYSQYKSYSSYVNTSPYFVSDIKEGTISKKIPSYMIQQPTDSQYGSEFTYTFWLFVNDTNFASDSASASCSASQGNPLLKHIFHKGSNDFYSQDNKFHYPILQSPGVWLYPNTNKLGINFNTYNNIVETCDIGNIPLNMWVNITIILIGNSVDVYVNGNLKKRQKLEGVPKLNYGDLYINNWNGFLGYISKLRYFNYAIQPYILDEIYKNGPGTSFDSNPSLAQASAQLSPKYRMTTGYPNDRGSPGYVESPP
jgi:hypothetical protein